MSTPRSARPEDVSSDWLLRPGGRPLFVFAHQDDETAMGGIVARILADRAEPRFVWWTNGDGLAPAAKQEPSSYAKLRIREADAALRVLGGSVSTKVDLESSEIENYRRLTHVAAGGALRREARDYFRDEARRIEQVVREADPDRVFVLAWQGGHPEHDLTHVMTARALRKLRRATGRPIPLVQCPAYEYVIACALRFKPWFKGDRRRTELSGIEMQKKELAFGAYESQSELFDHFRRVVSFWNLPSRILGRKRTVEDYLSVEEFGVVDPALDYRRSTHRVEALNYMLDDFEGVPIRFGSMVRPILEDLFDFEPI